MEISKKFPISPLPILKEEAELAIISKLIPVLKANSRIQILEMLIYVQIMGYVISIRCFKNQDVSVTKDSLVMIVPL